MNISPEVEDFMDVYNHPLKDLMQMIRQIVLMADHRMSEDIKWGAPTFVFKGNMATFNIRAKRIVNLTFHTGAEIRDDFDVLEGDAKEARVFRVSSEEELLEKQKGLEAVVKAWVLMKC